MSINKELSLTSLYIASALLVCGIIFSIIITPITININEVKWEFIITISINIIGIIFVVVTFKEQRRANKNQNKSFQIEKDRNDDLAKFNQIAALIEDIKTEFNSFQFVAKRPQFEQPKIVIGLEALRIIRIYFLGLQTKGRTDIKFDTSDVRDKFINFATLLIYTADIILEYPHDLNSKMILILKFRSAVSKFEDMLNDIAASTDSPLLETLSTEIINDFSREAYYKISLIANIPTEIHKTNR